MSMFCYQCEQTFRGTACEDKGVCGKDPKTAALQDVLLHQAKGISYFAHALRQKKVKDASIDRFVLEALFVTVTNVNFDAGAIVRWIVKAQAVKQLARRLFENQTPLADEKSFPPSTRFVPAATFADLEGQGHALSIINDHPDPDIRSLSHLLVYGLKGMAAYAHHALMLGYQDESIFAFTHEVLSRLNQKDLSVEELFEFNMRCGRVNLKCMEILDEAHTKTFGHPEPTVVSKTLRKGPAIIVSGHDLYDLDCILKQSEGKGISVYTHGEMLPAHGYPGLRKYKHFAGHFGTAWQNQAKEFDGVPAAFYFTTNCIQEPKASFKDRVFTGGTVGWPGARHIEGQDFSPLIEKAIELGGFQKEISGSDLMTGFGHHAVAGVRDKILEAIQSGAIKRFFLIGGCDGAKPGRNYYTDFAKKTPKDSVILTLACGKFRFNSHGFGTIGDIPRLLDVGQCNDAYSAVKIASLLAEALHCGVNDLPISFIISWYEQKAVAVLLTLLSLGIKGIRLGPSLPAFVSPTVLKVLVDKFDIRPIKTASEDLEEILSPETISS